MSSSSSNLPDPNDASPPRSQKETASKQPEPKNVPKEVEAQAVETFEFDVTAGSPAQAKGVGHSAPTAPQPKAPTSLSAEEPHSASVNLPVTESPNGSSPKGPSPRGPSVKSSAEVITEKPAPVAVELPAQVDIHDDDAPPAVGTARRVARQSSWWITSLGVHILLIVSLAFSTLAVMQEEELELYASPAVYETIEEFEDLEIDPTEELDSLEEELDTELNTPDPDSLANLGSETLIEEPAITEPVLGESASQDLASSLSDSLAELGQLFGDNGTGLSGMDDEMGTGAGGAMAKFFGTEIKARRILYMLDNSGGMRKGGKFEALVSELQKSVSRLQPKQKFYIIFYSDTVYPLFFPYSVREFIKSNPKSQKKLGDWLDSVELCGGNAIDEALAAAEVIRPDAIFLLTDGDLFTTPKKKALLLNNTGRSYAIHTFGLGVKKESKASDELQQVAKANKGTFRAIKVTDEMKALAKNKERPYHNKKPGPVWGIKVGKR